MTTSTKTLDEETFVKENESALSSCKWLRDLEIRNKQTIEINKNEKDNPNQIVHHLDFIKDNYGLIVDDSNASDFFVQTPSDKRDFEQILLDKFEENTLSKAVTRAYHYLVLLNRKSMQYQYKDLNIHYNFSLNDIYQLKDIKPKCFNDLSEIPSNIVKRCKVSYSYYQLKTRKYVRQLTSLNNQFLAKHSKMQNVANDSDLGKDKKQSQINEINSELKGLEKKVEKLSFEIEEDLHVEPRTEAPTMDDVMNFITNFVCYAIHVEPGVINKPKQNHVEEHNNMIYTTDRDIIYSATTDALYFQDTVNLTWVSALSQITKYVEKLAPTLRANQSSIINGLDSLLGKIKQQNRVSIFTFKPHTLFFQNGIMTLEFQDDGSIKHQFTHHKSIKRRKLMFHYATKFRLNIRYNESIDYVFKNNPENEPVTPDYIFGALGRRGYEPTEFTSENERQPLIDEGHARGNLFMQYFIRTLLPYEEIPALKDTFMYMYNSANSGKSTFMKLLNECVGNDLTAQLNIKDFDSSEQFGLINIVDKLLVTIDEASDGTTREKIDTKNIKKVSSKETLKVNVKNRDYTTITPYANLVFASNGEPTFTDESEGTERRLLAVQLLSSYSSSKEGKNKDLTFIKDTLVSDNDFKSACIKWVLEHVNIHQEVPESVRKDSQELISKEDDVQGFINDRVRETIDEPLFINADDLYELYKIESISRGRQVSKIRNKSNFKKAVMKLRTGVYQLKNVSYSKVDVLNRLVTLTGELFYDVNHSIMDSKLDNALSRFFIDTINHRKKALHEFYDDIIAVSNKQMKLSRASRGKSIMFAILPNSAEYNQIIDDKSLRNISTEQKNRFITKTLNDTVVKNIKLGTTENLPLSIKANVSNKFNHYSLNNFDDKNSYYDFTKY